MASKNKNASDNADGEEQSMEEILQSIRRIIAEEEEAISLDPATVNMSPNTEATEVSEDILELTQEVTEEPAQAEQPVAENKDTIDFDKLFGSEPLVEENTDEPVVHFAEDFPEPPKFEPTAPEPEQVETPASLPTTPSVVDEDEALVSDMTAAATIEALKAIKHLSTEKQAVQHLESHAFRSGVTIEDLVIEALRPMLKDWLDANLPTLVERIVQKEVRKLVQKIDE